MADDAPVDVHLRGVPVALWRRSQEHSDELLREFMLIASEQREGSSLHDVPQRLMALIEDVTARYAGLGADNEDLLTEAARGGVESIDLDYAMPAAVVDAVVQLDTLLDAADDYCRSGEHLLTLATPPDLVQFRKWFLGEFVRQMSGASPLSWAEVPVG